MSSSSRVPVSWCCDAPAETSMTFKHKCCKYFWCESRPLYVSNNVGWIVVWFSLWMLCALLWLVVTSSVAHSACLHSSINPTLTSSLKQLLLAMLDDLTSFFNFSFMKQVIKVTLNLHQIRVRSPTAAALCIYTRLLFVPGAGARWINSAKFSPEQTDSQTQRQQHDTRFIFRTKPSVVLMPAQTSKKRDKSKKFF